MSTLQNRTLYISRERVETRSKDKLRVLLTKGREEDKIDALWQIVKETGMGMDHQDLLLTLTTVLPTTKDKRLVLLFYLYMESVCIEDEEGNLKDEILMVCNMIRSHLMHPNEHVRTKAIRLVGRFRNAAIFDALKAPFAENLTYSNPYVRSAVYIALRSLMRAPETRGLFENVFGLLKEQLSVERDGVCLAEGYKTLEETDASAALELYTQLEDTTHARLQGCFLRTAERLQDLERVYRMSQRSESKETVLEASILLVRMGTTEEIVREGAEKLLALSGEYLDASAKRKIVQECRKAHRRGACTFEGLGLKFGRMVTPGLAKVNASLEQDIFAFVMEILVIVEAKEWFSYLYQQFTDIPIKEEKTHKFGYEDKVFFLGALREVLSQYKIHKEALTASVVELLHSSIPELALGATEYIDTLLSVETSLRAPVIVQVLRTLGKIQYGKILRKVFGLVKSFADKRTACQAVESLFSALGSQEKGVLGQLEAKEKDTAKVFPGVCIAEFLLSMRVHVRALSSEEEAQTSLRINSTSTALKAYAIGERTGALDAASKIALLNVAEAFSSETLPNPEASAEESVQARRKPGILRPERRSLYTKPHFSLIKQAEASSEESPLSWFMQKQSTSSLGKLKNVFQLTSQMDPLYCECQVTCSRTEIILDALLVNQTDKHLEDIEFDLVPSANIKVVHIPVIPSIRPHTAQTFTATLLMEEADAGFIGGIVTAGRMGRENFFSQYLQEIRFNLADMLKHKEMGKEEFRERWSTLLWENFYTITIMDHSKALGSISAEIEKEIKGTVVDMKSKEEEKIQSTDGKDPSILVKNILTTTSQGTDMFVNAMLMKTEKGTTISFRIRGNQCRVVKSLCQLISKKLKRIV
ncbi:coatomer subunit beta [Nematocida sp. AWRm77]|nr:coatomer subunit beta [Nematocida sp. AWRm77]